MSFVAVAIGGSALIGAGASIIGGNKAANAQTNAANQATAIQQAQLAEAQRQYDQGRTDLAPYREAGYTALGQLARGTADGGEFNRDFTMADYEADPGYQFRLDQGNRGIEASAAARGGVLSGGTLKALAKYNSGMASQEYGAAYDRFRTNTTDRYNRIANVAGVGQQAVGTGISAGQANTQTQQAGANAIADNVLSAGNARASSYVNTSNAIGNAAGQVGQYFALRDLYKPTSGVYGGNLGGIY
jgi:hypothetical protein